MPAPQEVLADVGFLNAISRPKLNATETFRVTVGAGCYKKIAARDHEPDASRRHDEPASSFTSGHHRCDYANETQRATSSNICLMPIAPPDEHIYRPHA
jgi:hypothetical protein